MQELGYKILTTSPGKNPTSTEPEGLPLLHPLHRKNNPVGRQKGKNQTRFN